MKKSNTIVLTLLFAITLLTNSSQAQMSQFIGDTLSKVFHYHQNRLNMNGVAVAVCLPDGSIWSEAAGKYGYDMLHTNMLYDIGSNTKTMVASIILMLEEENKLSIDDQLSTYLPPIDNITPGITLKQLLSHRSGLYSYTEHPDFNSQITGSIYKVFTPDEVLDLFVNSPLSPPGTKYRYSNTNYILLGLVIEAIENKPLYKVMRERIFDANNLSNTYLDAYENYTLPKPGVWFSPTQYDSTNYVSFMSSAWAAGGVVATPEDFAQWGHQFYRGDMLSNASMQKMTNGESTLSDGTHYGLGVMKHTINGYEYLFHGGTTLQNSEIHYSVSSDFVWLR